jgi:hypothetical protein
MNDKKEFLECAECTCRPKMAGLCVSCLHNRNLITGLQKKRDQAIKENQTLYDMMLKTLTKPK